MKLKALAAAVLLVVSTVGPAAAVAAGTAQDSNAYAGTHVSFDMENGAIADYSVDGTTVVDSVAVQSVSKSRSSGNVGANVDLATVTNFQAAGLSVQSSASSSTHATLKSDSGATVKAHDNDCGIMVVEASGESQFVRANLSAGSSAEQSGEQRVVVTKESGQSGAFLVVGDGKVTVNDDGNVSAELSEGSKLVYRQYDGERSDSDEKQEQLITDGTATAEVYYQQAEESGDDGQQRTADVVNYSESTTVEVTERSADRVNMTVERAESQGKVVLVSVSEAAMKNAQNAQVTVDGEAAVEASSYSEVESATQGGESSKYLVESSSSAEAATDVVVGINHFSARQLSIQSSDEGTATDEGSSHGTTSGEDATDEPTDGSGPGFGAVGAIAALGAALFARANR